MTTTSTEAADGRIAQQLERAFRGPAWHGPAILELLDGVSAAGATAKPDGAAHSIAELVGHITYWLDAVRRRIEEGAFAQREGEDWTIAGGLDDAGWRAILAELERAHTALVRTVCGLDPGDLTRAVEGHDYDVYTMLHGVVQHTLWHGGQIALLRRMVGPVTS
ncbi:MAG: DinB family protein [Longimicrobiales bacterium]